MAFWNADGHNSSPGSSGPKSPVLPGQPLPAERAAYVAAVREALGFRTINQEQHGNVIEVQTAKRTSAGFTRSERLRIGHFERLKWNQKV